MEELVDEKVADGSYLSSSAVKLFLNNFLDKFIAYKFILPSFLLTLAHFYYSLKITDTSKPFLIIFVFPFLSFQVRTLENP